MTLQLILTVPLLMAAGWLSGSLVNYLADVLPFRRRLTIPFCLRCESSLPLIHYFVWPSRCAHCGANRSRRTWVVQIVYLMISIWLWFSEPRLGYPLSVLLLIFLGLVTIVDIEHRLILHPVSIAGALLALVIGVWQHGLVSTLVGGVAGFVITLGFYYLGLVFVRWSRRLRHLETQEDEGLGFGDVNLSGVLGLLLGWPGILAGLILAVVLAGAVSLIYLFMKVLQRQYSPDLSLPYGPFLVLSAVLLIFRPSFLFG